MKNGQTGIRYVMGRHLGADAGTARLPMKDTTRNTLLILGFGLSAALMFVTIYPRRQQ
jgi:hypothetical protein